MSKRVLVLILVLVLLAVSISVFTGCSKKADSIVVGAKDYTEQDILGNILMLLIENNTDLKVTYKQEMSSNVLFAALQSGAVNVSIDYTGTVYANYLGHTDVKSAAETYEISKKELSEKYKIRMLDPLGYNNTYCLAVREDTAAKYNLKTFSDLAKVSSELVFGGTFEILNRPDGIPNLKIAYDMTFKDEKGMDGTLRYTAIAADEIQINDAFSTDGMLVEFNLVVLEDDKSFFPPYHAIPLIREDTAAKYPQLLDVLAKLANVLNDDGMRELNYRVDVLKQNPVDVARNFLKEQGLIN